MRLCEIANPRLPSLALTSAEKRYCVELFAFSW